MVRPGSRYAFERTRCSSSFIGMFGESKYFGSGHRRTMVPVRFSLIFSLFSLLLSSPPSNAMVCFWPSRNTVTSQRFDSAFDTATPTPCRPPEMWYTPSPERENLPPACSMVNATSTAGFFSSGCMSTGTPRPSSARPGPSRP